MTDSIRPDQVIPPNRPDGLQLGPLVKDIALLVPNLAKLLTGLLRDPRVPRRSKVLVGAMVAYLVSPVDAIPDFIPAIGKVDDILIAAFTINHLIERAGADVVLEHWDGPNDILEMVQTVLDATGVLVPTPLRRWVDRFSG